MGAIIGTLFMIAASYGLGRFLDKWDHLKSKDQGISSDQVLKASQDLLKEAKSKSNNIMQKVSDKLGSIPTPIDASPSLKSFLANVKRDNSDKYNNVSKRINEVEQKLTAAENRSNNIASQSDYTRKYMQQENEDNLKDIKSQIDQLNSIERSIK